MKLFKVDITKDALLNIPKPERLLFIQVTNLANELFVLQKLVFCSMNDSEEHGIITTAENMQALFLIRLTAAKLWEGWRLLETHYFNDIFSKDYASSLSPAGQSGLDRLKAYFSDSCLIKKIRDEYAFHYSSESSDAIDVLLNSLEDSEVFSLYMAERHGNCMYELSHTLLFASLLHSMNTTTREDAIATLLDEIIEINKAMLAFIEACVVVFCERYIGFQHEEIEVPDPPPLDDISIPYFVGPPNHRELKPKKHSAKD